MRLNVYRIYELNVYRIKRLSFETKELKRQSRQAAVGAMYAPTAACLLCYKKLCKKPYKNPPIQKIHHNNPTALCGYIIDNMSNLRLLPIANRMRLEKAFFRCTDYRTPNMLQYS